MENSNEIFWWNNRLSFKYWLNMKQFLFLGRLKFKHLFPTRNSTKNWFLNQISISNNYQLFVESTMKFNFKIKFFIFSLNDIIYIVNTMKRFEWIISISRVIIQYHSISFLKFSWLIKILIHKIKEIIWDLSFLKRIKVQKH
jgi:hypothetical protein